MSDNVRVYEIAEEAGASSNDVIKKAKDLGIELKSPQSQVSYEDAEEIANYIMTGKSERLQPKKKAVKKTEPKKVEEVQLITEEKKPEKIVAKPVKIEEPKEKAKPVIAKPKKIEETSQDQEETDDTQEETDDTLFVKKVVPKRRGLKIVKKKKPEEEIVVVRKVEPIIQETAAKKPMKSLSEILGGNTQESSQEENNSAANKSKVQKKKAPPKAHEHGKVLEIVKEDFKESDDSLLGKEVVLLDMGLSDTSKLFD